MEYILGGGNECIVLPNLIEYDESGNYTKELKKIEKDGYLKKIFNFPKKFSK